jgi:hypothetical protein
MPRDSDVLAIAGDFYQFVEGISRLTLFEESGEEPAEDSPADYEWLVANHETLEGLITAARDLIATVDGSNDKPSSTGE